MLDVIVVDTIVVDDLIKSQCKSGFKGVEPSKDKFLARCNTAACRNNYLGSFGTPEEAAQAYLQHGQIHAGVVTVVPRADGSKRTSYSQAAGPNHASGWQVGPTCNSKSKIQKSSHSLIRK
jgi:hypothetical protein